MTAGGFAVKTNTFEGPFDLLLSLVSRHKLDIFDVPLHKVTDDYLAYLETIRELDLDVASEFLVVAAILLDIKAQGLVGDKEEDSDNDEGYGETEEILASRLAEYRKYKAAGQSLSARLQVQAGFYPRPDVLEPGFERLVPDFTVGVSIAYLAQVYKAMLERESRRLIDAGHIAKIRVSVEAMVEMLLAKLTPGSSSTFAELVEELSERDELVAAFLALLQLIKRGQVTVRQAVTFGEIEVTGLGV